MSTADAILKVTVRVLSLTRTLLLYRLLQFASLPLFVFYFVFRFILTPGYSNKFAERFGFLPRSFSRTRPNSVWLHAVSVGEVLSAIPLIKHIRGQEPRISVYLSVSTVAGRRAAEREADPLVDGLFYAPFDYASCVRRALRSIRPALVIVFETEIWPNLYAEVKRAGALLAIVNGRISNRTWERYRKLKRFFCPVLRLCDAVYVQSDPDCSRYRELGVTEDRLTVTANLKYDAAVPDWLADIPTFGAEQVWIAASTVGPNERGSFRKHQVDEDDIVIEAFSQLAVEFPRLLLILAPRQPARFDLVAQKLQRAHISFSRRSKMRNSAVAALELPGVLLLDTLGELSSAYHVANVVFVGGSLAPRGGHNIIEPAAAGTPVIVGPHMQNFESITRDFLLSRALEQIGSAEELLPAVRCLLRDQTRARELGSFARRVVQMRRGVAQRLAHSLISLYYLGQYRPPHNIVARYCLRLLTSLWSKGGKYKRRLDLDRASIHGPLPVPVISVGAITIGGSGKTPFTTYLASQLVQRNYAPAILTRGYKRRSYAESVVLAAGAKAPSLITGDEAQIFLRAGVATVGIGRNRHQTAHALLERFPSTNVVLLDDGFQHAPLQRDLDVVVIDGLDPFGGRELVPLGRLREPLSALHRSDVFVVTRAESELRFRTICDELRKHNASAPVFRTRLLARNWREYPTGDCVEVKQQPVAAFCGLGNPQNFWDTLDSLGLNVVFRWAFEDHHTYRPVELQYFGQQATLYGAKLLVTTEKDRMNFPGHLTRGVMVAPLVWLEIELELQDSAAFFSFIESTLRRRSAA